MNSLSTEGKRKRLLKHSDLVMTIKGPTDPLVVTSLFPVMLIFSVILMQPASHTRQPFFIGMDLGNSFTGDCSVDIFISLVIR